ncbi:hypothetical protein PoB_006371200 [Plakobranchus ocellatus]|uniref:Uncharacterized protein n=1 Tax=Plakobranchus ocellatus TaxID=259542 RepID=A0AAV4CZ31_9GAST|nr:hypothetical protein PoB_006371200 [Plakobranchus ocellatus]
MSVMLTWLSESSTKPSLLLMDLLIRVICGVEVAVMLCPLLRHRFIFWEVPMSTTELDGQRTGVDGSEA